MGTDAMRKMFKQALAAAGLSSTITPHDLRHTFATDVLSGGAMICAAFRRCSVTQAYPPRRFTRIPLLSVWAPSIIGRIPGGKYAVRAICFAQVFDLRGAD